MTVIVKPRAATADTSDEVATKWLYELLGSISWPQFEATENGDLTILNTKFSMRIGIFMTMPTQAIFAGGIFLRMRQRKEFDTKDLHTLIADNIDSCLYNGSPSWKPKKAPASNPEEDYLKKMIDQWEDTKRQSTNQREADYMWQKIIETKNKIERMKAASPIMLPMYGSEIRLGPMTVIVQPITVPPPESASDVITQYLQKLLGTLTYENFAATPDGNITLLDTVFHYRVGLFLAVPTEVIIAADQFVKMHQIKEKAKYWTGLKVIDPNKPDDCLYERYANIPNANMTAQIVKGWCPSSLQSEGVGQNIQGTLYAQHSLVGQQGIAGLGQWGQSGLQHAYPVATHKR